MHMYMAVTPDEYELPLAVRDTAREIAEIYGKKTSTVLKAVSSDRSGRQSGVKFIKVEGIEKGEVF